jgi:ClpP class serine protease
MPVNYYCRVASALFLLSFLFTPSHARHHYYHILYLQEEFSPEKAASEKIAIVNIEGSINDALAHKTVAHLRKIKKDKTLGVRKSTRLVAPS